MKNSTILSLGILIVLFMPLQKSGPDFQKVEDLKVLGIGTLYEKDKTSIKNITLFQVHEFWIVYLKNGSSHDISIEKIDRIEFRESQWGRLKITFTEGKAEINNILN